MTDDGLEAAVDGAMAAVIAWQKRAREALWASPSRSQVRETIRAQWERAEAAEAKLSAVEALCRECTECPECWRGEALVQTADILAITGTREENRG